MIILNRTRLIVTSVISVVLVAVLMLGSTYSIFTSSDVDESANVYTTGNLDVTYTLSEDNIKIESIVPMKEEESINVVPYRIIVTNNGNVPYMFDVILNDTTAGNVIDYKYIMTSVGKLEAKALSECVDNVIKEDVIVPANNSVIIDVRIWLSDKLQNTEIGKSFYAKLSIDGLAVYDEFNDIDNKMLIAEKPILLSEVTVGSYIKFVGDNGCNSKSCNGQNMNYISDENLGYCGDDNFKYNSNGWRLAYLDDSIPYLISGGAVDCLAIDNKNNNEIIKDISKANEIALKYCNVNYAYDGKCSTDNSWSFGEDDFVKMTNGKGSILSGKCNKDGSLSDCGRGNNLIDNGGYYWAVVSSDDDLLNYWNPNGSYFDTFSGNNLMGIRPILKLRNDIIVVGGKGTYDNPYRIATNEIKVTDLSGNGNHGINNGGVLDKKSGTVLTDGNKSFVDLGMTNYDFGNKVTFVARVKFNSIKTGNINYILGNFNDAGFGIFVDADGNFSGELYVDDKNNQFHSNFKPTVDVWYTVVLTYDNSSIVMYVNGEKLVLTEGSSNVSGDITISDLPIYIGGKSISDGSFVNGANASYDDVLIFYRALTIEEIKKSYSEKIDKFDNMNLLLHYDFD